MIVDLTLPRLGGTMETGRIAAWLKQPGEAFRRGETVVEVESDKTVVEIPALADGIVVEIVVPAGEDADVGAVLCRYEDGLVAVTPAAPACEAAPASPLVPEPVLGLTLPMAVRAGSSLRATPLARAVARQHGIARVGRTVIAADLPGHGATSIETTDIETAVATATAFLERLGGDPVELVGHSFGGAVAARAAQRAPARVRRLTLLAPAGLDRGIDIDFVRGIARVRAAGALQHLLRRLTVRPAALTPAQLDALALELSRGRLIGLADALVDDGGQ